MSERDRTQTIAALQTIEAHGARHSELLARLVASVERQEALAVHARLVSTLRACRTPDAVRDVWIGAREWVAPLATDHRNELWSRCCARVATLRSCSAKDAREWLKGAVDGAAKRGRR